MAKTADVKQTVLQGLAWPDALPADQRPGPAKPSWAFSAPGPPPGSSRGCGALIGQKGCCLLPPAVPVLFQVGRDLALTVEHGLQRLDAFEKTGSIWFRIASFRTLMGFPAERTRQFGRVNRIAAIVMAGRAELSGFYGSVDRGLAFSRQLCGLGKGQFRHGCALRHLGFLVEPLLHERRRRHGQDPRRAGARCNPRP